MSFKRTPKETSILVEKAINQIRKHKNPSDDLIKKTCEKYDVKESYVNRIINHQ